MYKGYVLPWQRVLKSFRWLDFFLPSDQFLPLWHGCMNIIVIGTSFSLLLVHLSRLVAKEQGILLTIQNLKR